MLLVIELLSSFGTIVRIFDSNVWHQHVYRKGYLISCKPTCEASQQAVLLNATISGNQTDQNNAISMPYSNIYNTGVVCK